jgi:uncharacterized protein YkwD
VKRCPLLLIALISTLSLAFALPDVAGAARAHSRRHRGSLHVRDVRIHRAPRKGPKHSCRRSKGRKHGKRVNICRAHKKDAAHHAHKRVVHRARRMRPATAADECSNANLTPNAGNIASVVAATLCLVNDERIRFGEPALIEDPRLAAAAASHSRDMDERDYFSHTSPTGQTLLMRIEASGFIPNGNVGYTLGENIAWGTLWLGTPRTIVKAWMESPGHRANILDEAFRYTGVGVDPNLPRSMSGGQAGGMYTQDFGTITP